MSKTFANSQYAVVGAGLIGRLLAVALAKRGAQVEIYEQGAADEQEEGHEVAIGGYQERGVLTHAPLCTW